jgi:hypothetical protein
MAVWRHYRTTEAFIQILDDPGAAARPITLMASHCQ